MGHIFSLRDGLVYGDLGVPLSDGVEEMVVGDRLTKDGVEVEEAFLVEGCAKELFVEDGLGNTLAEVVGGMDLTDIRIVGYRAQGDYVVDSFEVEIGVPCLDQSVHARANDVLGDSIFPSAGDAVVE